MLENPAKTTDELIRWLADYFEKNGPGCKAVIGISGGKDSSVCAALCAKALGKDRVLGVLMPNGVQEDIEDARDLVHFLDIPFLEINIQNGFLGMKNDIGSACLLSRDALINLPPRLRMATLYAVAQSIPEGGRVINTCNRSEDYVGYSTKFGDSAGDVSPLMLLLVEEVKQIGRVLGLPLHLVDKTPSDGLSGSSDEEKLGFSYATLDHYIQTGECENASTKQRIDRLHRINEHKLLPMPRFDPAANSK